MVPILAKYPDARLRLQEPYLPYLVEVTSSAHGFRDLARQVGTCKDTPHINQRVHHDIAGHQPLTNMTNSSLKITRELDSHGFLIDWR